MKENSLSEELRRNVIIMRRQDENLSGLDVITVQIFNVRASGSWHFERSLTDD